VGDGGGWGRGRAVLVVARVAGAILIREVWYGRGRVVVSWRLQAIFSFFSVFHKYSGNIRQVIADLRHYTV
jgi:hypothetical protein